MFIFTLLKNEKHELFQIDTRNIYIYIKLL